MTTVSNPSSSPVPVYNRSGTTIEKFNVSSGSGIQTVVAFSGHTIVVANVTTPMSTSDALLLPSGSEIGDVVEFLAAAWATPFYVIAPVGENINTYANFPVSQSARFIKVDATTWLFA